ncbi:tyrosine-type recombinase/integrase [Neorhizobium galegae]|uniref:DUF6538 domain-containing protein n=1 Tax=Neorhizobium galegae TaxID=399 RepID=UPI0021018CDD|nr:DUF6538 domain-containing protein [Neorhizobium galegae]MCQ1571730.1 tyrosine-type recombinase/integrase [Neorhizobium galegae]
MGSLTKQHQGGWPGDKRHLMRKTQDGVWYATIDVPRPLRTILGKKRLVRSLQTRDLGEAQRSRWKVIASFHEEIAAATTKSSAEAQDQRGVHVRLALEAREEMRSIEDSEDRDNYSDMIETVVESMKDSTEAEQFRDIALRGADPIDLHLERYFAATTLAARSKADATTAVGELTSWLKKNKHPLNVQRLTSRLAGEYRDSLVSAKMHVRTLNKKISLLSSYWRWLGKAGVIDADKPNPWKGKSLPKPKAWRDGSDQTGMRPFTDEEVSKLLAGKADKDMMDLMKIAALSGMRIEEIGQLRVADCANDLFNIRRAKTKASIRKVPIHPELKEIIAARVEDKAQDGFIFPDFKDSGWDGARTMAISKAFGRYRKDIGVDETPEGSRRSRIDFHSFRRWFARKCEEAGQQQNIVARVMGHEIGLGITFGTYSRAQPLDLMRSCVESVKLPNVEANRKVI